MYFNYEPYGVVFPDVQYIRNGRNYYGYKSDAVSSEIHIGHDNIHTYEVMFRQPSKVCLIAVRMIWDCHRSTMHISCTLSHGHGWLPEYEVETKVPDFMTEEQYFQQSLLQDIPITNESINEIRDLLKRVANEHKRLPS